MTTYGPWFTISGSYQAQVGVNFRQVPDNASITSATSSVTVYADEYLNINYSISSNTLHVASGNDFPASGDIAGVTLSHGERLLRTTSRVISLAPGSGGSSTFSGTVSGLYGNAGVVVSSGAVSWTTATRPYGNGSVGLSATSFNLGDMVTVTAHRTNTTDQIQVYWTLPGDTSNRQEYLTNSGISGKVTSETVSWGTSTDTVLAGLLASSTVMSGTLYCDYWDASSNYLGTSSVGFTTTVPSTVVPTTGAVSSAETTASVTALGVGEYVQGVSVPCLTIASQAGIYSSPIVSGTFTVNSVPYTIAAVSGTVPAFTLPAPLSASGGITVSAYVTDARGHSSAPVGTTLSTLAYSLPSITAFDPTMRCSAGGAADPLGTYINVFSKGSASTLTNGAQFNTLSWTIKTQPASGGTATTYTPAQGVTVTPPTLQWDHSSGDILGGGGLLASSSYYVTLTATDALGNYAQATTLLTAGVVTMSWSQTGVGVGKIWQRGALDVGGDAYVRSGVLVEPPGIVKEYAGSTAPTGYLLCDGSAVSRATYAALYAVISTTFGAGDGSTTFNLPDHRGRVGLGVGTASEPSGWPTAHSLGQKAGEENHSLTADENGPHTHSIPNEDGQPPRRSAGQSAGRVAGVTSSSYTDWTPSTASTGSGTPHNNLPPYIGMNFIITT